MPPSVPRPHDPHRTSNSSLEPTGPPSYPSRRRALIRVGCLSLTGGLLLSGGLWSIRPGGPLTEDGKLLRALRNDPMGAETILNHRASETDETKPTEWFSIENPHISLTRWFQGENGDIDSLHKSFIRYAEKNGWAEETDISTSNAWIARHHNRAADDYMRLAITVNTENDSTTPKERLNPVAVSLDYS